MDGLEKPKRIELLRLQSLFFLSLCPFCRLRALSSGGSVASPPPSPAMPKYKLADYRYGREEMLALYVKEDKVGVGRCRVCDPVACWVSATGEGPGA